MKPTRQSQPYRASGSRGPSQVLDRMRAGRAVGAPTTAAQRQAARPLSSQLAGVRRRLQRPVPRQ